MNSRSFIVTILPIIAFASTGCGDSGLSNQRADQVGETVVGQAMARGKDTDCMNNLRQIRAALEIAKTTEETPPADLNGLKLPASMLMDPIDKKPYTYDPQTGTVKCDHPGHKKY